MKVQHHQGHAKVILITLLFFSLSELFIVLSNGWMSPLLSMRMFYYDVSLSSVNSFCWFLRLNF